MAERGVDVFDLQHALYSGVISRKPYRDVEHESGTLSRDWKYRVEGTDVEGYALTVIVALCMRAADQVVRVVTVF